MIPILRETYVCTYPNQDGSFFKPVFQKVKEEYLKESLVYGVLTAVDSGHIPSTTLCYPLSN